MACAAGLPSPRCRWSGRHLKHLAAFAALAAPPAPSQDDGIWFQGMSWNQVVPGFANISLCNQFQDEIDADIGKLHAV